MQLSTNVWSLVSNSTQYSFCWLHADPATGGSEDFGYKSLGVKYSYVVELRDEGEYGFILPANQIQPVSEEMLEGMIEVGKQLVIEYP